MANNSWLLPGILGLCIVALLGATWWRYWRWAKHKKFLRMWFGFMSWPTVPALLGWVFILTPGMIINGIMMIIWIILRLCNVIEAVPGEPLQEVIPAGQPDGPRYEYIDPDAPQLESPEMAAKRRQRAAAAIAWQLSLEGRAKADAGDARAQGSFTTAIQMQPGDLKIIRVGIAAYIEEFGGTVRDYHGYLQNNVVYVQISSHKVVGEYSILAGTVKKV